MGQWKFSCGSHSDVEFFCDKLKQNLDVFILLSQTLLTVTWSAFRNQHPHHSHVLSRQLSLIRSLHEKCPQTVQAVFVTDSPLSPPSKKTLVLLFSLQKISDRMLYEEPLFSLWLNVTFKSIVRFSLEFTGYISALGGVLVRFQLHVVRYWR